MADDDQRGGSGGDGWWPEEEPKQKRKPTTRLAKEAEEGPTRPPRGLASPGRPRPSGRYTLFVGVVFVALIAVALLNLVNNEDAGIRGTSDDERGLPLAEFAVPTALATANADANIAQDDCETSRNPCPEDELRTPACEIDATDAIRVCDLFDKPLAISFWFTRGGDCIPTQDAFDEVASRFRGRVNFLSINVRDDPEDVAGIVRERGWSVPIGLDRDGAVSNLYRVGVCPTFVFAFPGGILYEAEIGNQTVDELADLIDGLTAASRTRAEETR
jgi:thiol-disulfide isomerase/thioredoxin